VLRANSSHEAVEDLTTGVCEILDTVPMPPLARSEFEIAVVEALNNAAEHGNGGDPHKQVKVVCRTEPGRVVLAIEDQGEGFDPDDLPDPTAEENLLREDGRGILLMRQLADTCRFEDDGRRVVLIKRIPATA
jgi:serine/threonine-protein kinase RsbW